VQLQGHDLVEIMGTSWDSSHDWSAVMDGYRLLRKDRLGGEEVELPFMWVSSWNAWSST